MGRTQEPLPDGVADEVQVAFPDLDIERARWVHGAFHFVAIGEGVVLRVRVGGDHREAIAAEAAITHRFAGLGSSILTPRVEIEPLHEDGWSAFGCTLLDGSAMQPGEWSEDRRILLPLLEELEAIGADAAAGLPEPRRWCGGAEWPAIVEEITRGWSLERRALVRTVLDRVAASDPESGVRHGDFGPHNVLLTRRGAALIDVDNACGGERGIDVAPLLGFYPVDALAGDFAPGTLTRAAAIRRSLPLQVAAAAELADDPELRDHALANFVRRNPRPA